MNIYTCVIVKSHRIQQIAPGSDVDSMDEDEDPVNVDATIGLDPFDYVYSNLPDSTHIIKHAANCDHYKAKKFQ